MKRCEVVVTGVGMITPWGTTAETSAEGWSARRAVGRRALEDLRDTSLAGAQVATLPEFDAAQRLGERRMLKFMSDAAVIGCVAAREASTQAGLKGRFRPERVGLYAGAGLAAASVKDSYPIIRESIDAEGRFSCRLLGSRGLASTNPLLSFKILANMPACLVSILESVKGPNYIFTPWEGQTASALEEAWNAVADGEVDCALAGAADYPTHPSTYVFLRQSGLLCEGEFPAAAAAYLALERRETAARDNRPILAEIGEMSVVECNDGPHDPLSALMGRSFAAAPAVLLALASRTEVASVFVSGVDGQAFHAEVRRPRCNA